MTLHERPSDAELLERARQQKAWPHKIRPHGDVLSPAMQKRAANGVVLGPDSPLLKTKKSAGAKQAAATRRANARSEHADQTEIFRWASAEGAEIEPLLATSLFYAVPNVGTFSEQMGARANEEGRKKGVQDMNLDVARGGWHGLRIEQKVDGQRPSQEQVEHAQRLADQGYCHRFSYSPDYTKELLLVYLAGNLRR